MNKKGFTLIEVIVSIVLVSVVLISLLGSLIQLRSTYTLIHENSDVLVYTSSISRVINNDMMNNNGIRYVSCNNDGNICNIVLGNDSRRKLEIIKSLKISKNNGITTEKVQTTLEYMDTTEYDRIASPTASDESLKKVLYIRTLDLNKYTNDSSFVTSEGFAFDYMSVRQYEYQNDSEVDAFTVLRIKVNNTIDRDNSRYDIVLYASGRYDYEELSGKKFKIFLDNSGASYAGTTIIEESFGVAFFKGESNHTTADMIKKIDIPKKGTLAFLGYYYKPKGNDVETQIIDSSGNIIASNKLFKEDVLINSVESGESRVFAKWGVCKEGYVITDGLCKPKEYTITFNQNGGSSGSDSIKSNYHNMVPPITIPQRAGYVFNGYKTDDGQTYYDKNGNGTKLYELDNNITLTAQWSGCSAGTFSPVSSNVCTKCVLGSKSSANSGTCSACPNGNTTSAAGKSTCDIKCSNNNGHVQSWKKATWSTSNKVTNSCIINECESGYYLVSNECKLNILKNGDFELVTEVNAPSKTVNGITHTWDKELNGIPGNTSKAYFATNWSTGANMGVQVPEIGYHAHIRKVNNNYVVRFKTNEEYAGYTDANVSDGVSVTPGTITKNRWLGIAQTINNSLITAGKKYVLIANVYRVSGSQIYIYGGPYFATGSNTTRSFGAGQFTFKPSSTGTWEEKTWTFTLPSDYSPSVGLAFYFYGNGGVPGETYLDNVVLYEE